MNLVLLNMTIGYAPFSVSREKKEEKNSIRVVPASSASRCMLPSSATRGHLGPHLQTEFDVRIGWTGNCISQQFHETTASSGLFD